jgi:hypothetical protein
MFTFSSMIFRTFQNQIETFGEDQKEKSSEKGTTGKTGNDVLPRQA